MHHVTFRARFSSNKILRFFLLLERLYLLIIDFKGKEKLKVFENKVIKLRRTLQILAFNFYS